MGDDKTKRGPADRSRINIHEPYELTYWAEDHFKTSKDRIEGAVAAVGVMVSDVTAYLKKKGHIS